MSNSTGFLQQWDNAVYEGISTGNEILDAEAKLWASKFVHLRVKGIKYYIEKNVSTTQQDKTASLKRNGSYPNSLGPTSTGMRSLTTRQRRLPQINQSQSLNSQIHAEIAGVFVFPVRIARREEVVDLRMSVQTTQLVLREGDLDERGLGCGWGVEHSYRGQGFDL
ncbi:hypothetical protein WR25_05115 [Diploscapter pachys]|uniref:DUF3719 domain-containing protein n=1 Tax=Diploscapter pachys TaxID=2018661 RepID=A0A2A2K5C7_9BILA|nr:hypothetical protein WR25_05115 [Diploscapter pachys]